MPTADQITWLRSDVGANEISLPDLEAEALFARAEFISGTYAVQEPLTRIYYIRSLFASSAKMTTYRQNHTEEKLSDVFRNLKDLLAYWEAQLEDAEEAEAAGTLGAARSGRSSHLPTKYQEYPNSA